MTMSLMQSCYALIYVPRGGGHDHGPGGRAGHRQPRVPDGVLGRAGPTTPVRSGVLHAVGLAVALRERGL